MLFLSSNGVGLGHLTRLMAVARRLQHARPVFLTMSQAFRVVEASNWPVKYLPFHELSGCNVEHWNEWLRYEIEQVLTERPAIETVVFDGSNPYSGLLSAFAGSPIRKVWIQRGMWKKGHMSLSTFVAANSLISSSSHQTSRKQRLRSRSSRPRSIR